MPNTVAYDVGSWAEAHAAVANEVNNVVAQISRMSYQRVLQEQMPFLERLHQQYFDYEYGPDGRNWPPLAVSTIRKKGHDRILVDTSRLMNSLVNSAGPDAVRMVTDNELQFGTKVPYSIYHQGDCGAGITGSRGAAGTSGVTRRTKATQSLLRRILRGIGGFVSTLLRRTSVSTPTMGHRSAGRRRPASQRRKRPHVGLTPEALKQLTNNIADGIVRTLGG